MADARGKPADRRHGLDPHELHHVKQSMLRWRKAYRRALHDPGEQPPLELQDYVQADPAVQGKRVRAEGGGLSEATTKYLAKKRTSRHTVFPTEDDVKEVQDMRQKPPERKAGASTEERRRARSPRGEVDASESPGHPPDGTGGAAAQGTAASIPVHFVFREPGAAAPRRKTVNFHPAPDSATHDESLRQVLHRALFKRRDVPQDVDKWRVTNATTGAVLDPSHTVQRLAAGQDELEVMVEPPVKVHVLPEALGERPEALESKRVMVKNPEDTTVRDAVQHGLFKNKATPHGFDAWRVTDAETGAHVDMSETVANLAAGRTEIRLRVSPAGAPGKRAGSAEETRAPSSEGGARGKRDEEREIITVRVDNRLRPLAAREVEPEPVQSSGTVRVARIVRGWLEEYEPWTLAEAVRVSVLDDGHLKPLGKQDLNDLVGALPRSGSDNSVTLVFDNKSPRSPPLERTAEEGDARPPRSDREAHRKTEGANDRITVRVVNRIGLRPSATAKDDADQPPTTGKPGTRVATVVKGWLEVYDPTASFESVEVSVLRDGKEHTLQHLTERLGQLPRFPADNTVTLVLRSRPPG